LRIAVGAALAAAIILGIVATVRPKPTAVTEPHAPIFIDVGTDPKAQSAL
jgi:hypothetical protein